MDSLIYVYGSTMIAIDKWLMFGNIDHGAATSKHRVVDWAVAAS